jgi:hypothetical protein
VMNGVILEELRENRIVREAEAVLKPHLRSIASQPEAERLDQAAGLRG